MSKSRIVILVKTKEEIQEVYNMVMNDMVGMLHSDCYEVDIRQDVVKVESSIHNITIELLNTEFPYAMKGRRANLVILKDFTPKNKDEYLDLYEPMTSIGGYVIDYNTFVEHYNGRNRGYMRYDGMVNHHDYKMAQCLIEDAIGIYRPQPLKQVRTNTVAIVKYKGDDYYNEYRIGENQFSMEAVKEIANKDEVECVSIIDYVTYSRLVEKLK